MELQSLELQNFRNYSHICLDCAPGLTLLVGANAQGKTNLLEAVYFLSTTRTPRTRRERELIRFGASQFRVEARLRGGSCLAAALRRDGMRRWEENGESLRAIDFIGRLQAMFFTPDDSGLLRGAPEMRRRFFSLELSRQDRFYLQQLQEYRQVLRRRNALLADRHPERMLPHYDARLAESAVRVTLRMRAFIADLGPRIQAVLEKLPGCGGEEFVLRYDNVLSGQEGTEEELIAHLQRRLAADRSRDILTRSTQSGPHRDEYQFLLGGRPLRTYGSQGQVKSVVLALKLALMDRITEQTGIRPILLLDDISSELDAARLQFFLEHIQRQGQVFLTTTARTNIPAALHARARLYRIDDGRVTPEPQ